MLERPAAASSMLVVNSFTCNLQLQSIKLFWRSASEREYAHTEFYTPAEHTFTREIMHQMRRVE